MAEVTTRVVGAAAIAAAAVSIATGAAAADGSALYSRGLCPVCHGPDRKGTKSAPPLVDLSATWTVETLAAYLNDPAAGRENSPRIQELKKRYPSLRMPAFDGSEADRIALASWLLLASQAPAGAAASPAPAPSR